MTMNVNQYLNLIYNKPGHPAYLGGESILLREGRRKFGTSLSRQQVVSFLKQKPEYNIHTDRNKRTPKHHPKFVTTAPLQSISCDLAFFAKNKLIYLLCIDDHSGMKFAHFVGNRKTASSTLGAFKKIIAQMPHKPGRVRIDRGTEFVGLKKFLKDNKIQLSHLDTYQKAYNAEKFIGELRKIFKRYKTKTERKDIRPIIQNIISTMNKKYNRVIKMSPRQAFDPKNSGLVFEKRFLQHLNKKLTMPPPKYKVGDTVRVINFKNAAEEKSLLKPMQRYSSTIFRIYKALEETYPQQYLLMDENEKIISRPFLERHIIDVDERTN